MTIEEYADAINATIVIRRCANQNNRYYAYFDDCELVDGYFLTSEFGNGMSASMAVGEYVGKIRGRHIVFNAYSDHRREFDVPTFLENAEP